MARLFWTRAGW